VQARYLTDVSWMDKISSHVRLGNVTAVGEAEDRVWIFHRGSRQWNATSFDSNNQILYTTPISEETVLEIDANTGTILQQWGQNMFYMPHGLSLDNEGNVWLTDVGLHQVFKFSSTGQKLLTLGVAKEPSDLDSHFCKPTDVAVTDDGSFFVSDGYCNSRIMKFSKEGAFINKWGTPSRSLMSAGNLFVPHSLSWDSIEQKLYIADREHAVVQVFDPATEKFEIVYRGIHGLIYAVQVLPMQHLLYMVNAPHVSPHALGSITATRLDRTEAENLEISLDTRLELPHDLAVSKEGKNVYVASLAQRVFKYTRPHL